jgi:hypothetical protein
MSRISEFTEAIRSDFQSHLQEDEWYFSRIEERICNELTPEEAFRAIDEVVAILISSSEDTVEWRCATFMLSLALKSNTTELPPILNRHWNDVLECLSDHTDITDQLKKLYRKPAS